jgi:multiple sugar transport system permease protein
MLSPTIFFCAVMNVIGSFQVFDSVMAMTQGGPGRATNVLVYHIFNTAFRDRRFGYASSMAYVLFAVIMVFTLIQFAGQKKWVNY